MNKQQWIVGVVLTNGEHRWIKEDWPNKRMSVVVTTRNWKEAEVFDSAFAAVSFLTHWNGLKNGLRYGLDIVDIAIVSKKNLSELNGRSANGAHHQRNRRGHARAGS